MKKIVLLILIISTLVCIGLTVNASDIVYTGTCGTNGNNLTWTLDDEGLLTISGTGEMDYSYYAPWPRSKVKTVTIENGVTSIKDNAFYNCESLTNISMPDSLISIGEDVFFGCEKLTNITLPSNLKSIGNSAFGACFNLTSVYIEDIESWCDIDFSDGTSTPLCYGGRLYCGNTLVENLILPSTVTSIGDYQFSGCSLLKSITFHNNLTTLGKGAFEDCDSLTVVEIPKGISDIPSIVFKECDKLTNVIMPIGIISIGSYAFYGCDNLASVILPDTLSIIGEGAFFCCGKLENIGTIPKGLKSIGRDAFEMCYKLTKVNTEELESWCKIEFANEASNPLCGGKSIRVNDEIVQSLVIPKAISNIGNYQFFACKSLTDITIPEGVNSIGEEAFCACSNLKNITIPSSIKNINDNAFDNCTAIKNVYYYGTIEEWNNIYISDVGKGNDYLKKATIHYLKNIDVKGVALDKDIETIEVGSTAIINAIIAPESATNKSITWSSSNENVATVLDGIVTAKSVGIATITVKTVNGGYTASCVVTVVIPKVEITNFTATDYGANAFIDLRVVNTPADGVVYVASYDTLGKLLELQILTLNNGSASAIFSTSSVYKYKAFIWEGDTIRPLSATKECKLQ